MYNEWSMGIMKHPLPDKPVVRIDPITAYVDNQVTNLATLHPEVPKAQIEEYVRNRVTEHCKMLYHNYQEALSNNENLDVPTTGKNKIWPTVQAVVYAKPDDPNMNHSYGNQVELDNFDILQMFKKYRNKIICPFGSIYETADKQVGFVKGMLNAKTDQRKREKKLMFKAKKDGNADSEKFHHLAQATIKISMNSAPGSMGCDHNFLSHVPNFNSITSGSRYFTMNAYAHAERLLESNFYFKNDEQVLNFLINCQRLGPNDSDVDAIMKTYGLFQPSAEDVFNFLTENLHRYSFPNPHEQIKLFLKNSTPAALAFVWYMSNLRHIFQSNEKFFRPWLDKFFSPQGVKVPEDTNPEDLNTLDGELVVVLSTVYHHLIPTNNKGNSIAVQDTVIEYPDLAKKLYCYGKHMQACLDEIQPLFDLFTDHRVCIGYVPEHKQMFRNTVILSDTDSIIFTPQTLVKWYTGNLKMCPATFNMNSLLVYFLSKATASMLFHVSISLGAIGKDTGTMNMKNEFMMPIEIMTSLKKHYASILQIQEGVFYSTPRLDIKGVNLRGSNFSNPVLNFATWFIRSLIDEVYVHGEINASKYIGYTLMFERAILDSLNAGETKFLTVEPVKNSDEYSDAEGSIYYNYLFWEAVFGEKYGNIAIPTKCFMVPLRNKVLDHPQYTYFLETNFPDIAVKLKQWLTKNTKVVGRTPINPLTDLIPEELRVVMDKYKVITMNAKPLYLMLNSFGITNGSSKKKSWLFSDQYGWVKMTDHQHKLINKIFEEGELPRGESLLPELEETSK